jgi:hypothetical protein
MPDLISREAAKAAIRSKFQSVAERCEINEVLNGLPAVDAAPVEWLREKMQKPQITCANPFGFVLAEWLEEQEER